MQNILRNVLILVLLALPFSQMRVVVLHMPIYYPEILIVGALMIYAFLYKDNITTIYTLPIKITLGIGLFLSGAVMSVVVAGMTIEDLGSLKSWVILPLVYFIMIAQTFRRKSTREVALVCWYVGVVFVTVISLLPLPFIRETYDGRLSSYFPSPNHFAMFLAPGLLIGVYLIVSYVRNKQMAFMAGATTLVIFSAIVRTESSGALISVVIGIIFFISVLYVPRRIMIRSSIVVVLSTLSYLSLFILGPEPARLESGEVRTSVASRMMIWNASIRMIENHPFFGVGLRGFEREYLSLQSEFPPYLEWAVPHPHNLVLALWLQTGISGLLGFVLIVGYVSRKLWRRLIYDKEGANMLESALFLSLLLVFLTHGLVDTPFFKNDLSLQLFAVIGLALASLLSDTRHGKRDV